MLDLIVNLKRIIIIIIAFMICMRIVFTAWFTTKIVEINDLKNEKNINIGWLSFFLVLFFGVLGMITSAILCSSIPDDRL